MYFSGDVAITEMRRAEMKIGWLFGYHETSYYDVNISLPDLNSCFRNTGGLLLLHPKIADEAAMVIDSLIRTTFLYH